MMAPSTYRSSGCILAEPIPYRTLPLGHFEVSSMRLAQDFYTNPPEATATEPHERLYYQLPVATSPPTMGDRLTLPVHDGHSSSRSVSERSVRSDSSPERSETSHRSSTRSDITSKEKRKRASRPKVKTGCINCKRRHVKCDEGKPNCSKCESLGLDCEGYAPPKAPRPVLRTDRMLLPRPKPTAVASRPSARRYQSAGACVSLLAQPRLEFDGSSDDGWYFSLFRVQVAHDLSSDHRHNFWSQPSLRDSMTIRSIRHSVLSIGAYARALLDLKSDYPFLQSADRPWWPKNIVNRHHQAALDHHSKALSYLRQDIATNGVDSQTTMAANLLFIVFENMQGNYHSAGNLVRSGIKYLNQLDRDSTNTFKWRTYNEAPSQPGEIDEMARLFSQHSVASVNIPFPHCKNAYHLLLDHSNSSASSSFDDMDSFPLEFPAGDLIPHSFEQALTIWDGIIHSLARFTTYSMWINRNPLYSPDMEVMKGHQEHFITRLFEFGAGLALLTAERPGDMEARGLAYLGIHHLVATVMVSACLDRSEEIYDDFQPEFEEILRRTRHYLGLAGVDNRTGFANEVGVLPLIAFVAAKCRAPAPRTEAVALLRRHPWREGPWDGVSLARAMQELMRLEGQCPDDDAAAGRAEDMTSSSSSSPPSAEARFTWTNMFWDFENHRMTAEYTKITAKPGDELETRTVIMSPE